VVGLPLVLFVPGYAFIAALFPEAGGSPADEAPDAAGHDADAAPAPVPAATSDPDDTRDEGGIDGIERVALSFGTSIAIVPLIGLVLNFTPFGIRLVPILVSISGFTLLAVAVAAARRWALPPDERFRVPYSRWIASARAELFEPDDRADAALNVLLVVSVVLAAASVGYAATVPKQGEAFTELYLLTEGDDGDLVADDYPTEFVRGDSRSLVVGVGNNEHRPVNYTLVVTLQRVRMQNNSTTVLDESTLRRWQVDLPANRTWQRNHTISPPFAGERLRLAYLLYAGPSPADPTVENAYREVHLWINVSQPAATVSPARAATVPGGPAARP
jgi:uncharacterized membrane protein